MTQAVAWYTVARRIRPLACGRRYHRVAPVSASNLDSFRATIIPGAEPLLSRGSVMIVNVNERTGMKESADASNALFVKDGFEASGPRPDDHLPGVSAGRFAGCSAVMGITAMAQSRGWQVDAITAPRSPYERYDERHLDSLPAGTRVFSLEMSSAGLVDVPLRLFRAFNGLRLDEQTGSAGQVSGRQAQSSSDPVVTEMGRAVREFRDFARWHRWGRAAVNLVLQQDARNSIPSKVLTACSFPPLSLPSVIRAMRRAGFWRALVPSSLYPTAPLESQTLLALHMRIGGAGFALKH